MTGLSAATLVLLRHGESVGNRDGNFTGILDLPLTCRGQREATQAGTLLTGAGIVPDVVFTSTMRRARETVTAMRSGRPPLLSHRIPVRSDSRLNERNYGALTGRSKQYVRDEVGEARAAGWRRSLDIAPPPMSAEQSAGLLLHAAPDSTELGLTESLRDVVARVEQCYQERILPPLQAGLTVLVVAHGNSLRALCVLLDGLGAAAVAALNVPTGFPLLYRFTDAGRPVVPGGTYLNPDAASRAAEILTREGGT